MESFWTDAAGDELAQGDHLPNCLVPFFGPRYGAEEGGSLVDVAEADLIVVTQSCDLEHRKVDMVALCPIHSLSDYEKEHPEFAKGKRWENIRRGKEPALHMLGSLTDPADNRTALVVDFGHIISLPLEYLTEHAEALGRRNRLASPFLEHFSQAFARFFMRVGLPSSIPPFK